MIKDAMVYCTHKFLDFGCMGLYGYLQDVVPRSVKFDDADSKAATCPNRVLRYRRGIIVILLWSFGDSHLAKYHRLRMGVQGWFKRSNGAVRFRTSPKKVRFCGDKKLVR